MFVSYLADSQLAHATIKSYLSAVRHLQISHGFPDPHIGDMPRLEQVMRGIKSQHARQGRASRPRLPITPPILREMKGVWERDPSNFDHIMIWAACTLCFFGFLRSGEITVPADNGYDPGAHVSFTDVAIDDRSNPKLMRIRIKASKTDPFRKGVDIFVGRTEDDMCPISAMLAYLAIRGEGPSPLFRFASGKPLTRDRLVTEIRIAHYRLPAIGNNFTQATASELVLPRPRPNRGSWTLPSKPSGDGKVPRTSPT